MGFWAVIAVVVGIVLVGGFLLRRRTMSRVAASAAAAQHQMPDWVATLHDQLASTTPGENPTSNLLGEPRPAPDAPASGGEATAIRGRLVILATELEVAQVVRRHFCGMEGVTIDIVSDPTSLCADGQPGSDSRVDIDLLLTDPGRVAEIPPSLVCPIVPIRSPVRRARLLAEVRAGLEAARLSVSPN